MMRRLLGPSGKTVLRAGFSIAYDNEGLESFFGVAPGKPGLLAGSTIVKLREPRPI